MCSPFRYLADFDNVAHSAVNFGCVDLTQNSGRSRSNDEALKTLCGIVAVCGLYVTQAMAHAALLWSADSVLGHMHFSHSCSKSSASIRCTQNEPDCPAGCRGRTRYGSSLPPCSSSTTGVRLPISDQ